MVSIPSVPAQNSRNLNHDSHYHNDLYRYLPRLDLHHQKWGFILGNETLTLGYKARNQARSPHCRNNMDQNLHRNRNNNCALCPRRPNSLSPSLRASGGRRRHLSSGYASWGAGDALIRIVLRHVLWIWGLHDCLISTRG